MGVESGAGFVLEYYWSSWQVPVCAFIILLPTLISIHLITKHSSSSEKEDGFNYDDLWRPCWRNIHPICLVVYRLAAFLFMACLLYLMLVFAGPFAFYFYTQWTFTLVMLYFAVGVVISAQGCFLSSKKPPTPNGDSLTNNNDDTSTTSIPNPGHHDQPILKPSFLGNLMLIIYQTSAGASILTDLVFWCVLVPMMAGKEFELTLARAKNSMRSLMLSAAWLIGSIHSVNALFLIIDSFLNALPLEWFGFNYFILWSATYVTFQWILHACGSTWWPYPFLELSTPWAPLWYFGLAVMHIPCYGVYILLVKAKNSIFSKLFPQAFVRSHKQVWVYNKEA